MNSKIKIVGKFKEFEIGYCYLTREVLMRQPHRTWQIATFKLLPDNIGDSPSNEDVMNFFLVNNLNNF